MFKFEQLVNFILLNYKSPFKLTPAQMRSARNVILTIYV
jgi:hypothetical protein